MSYRKLITKHEMFKSLKQKMLQKNLNWKVWINFVKLSKCSLGSGFFLLGIIAFNCDL